MALQVANHEPTLRRIRQRLHKVDPCLGCTIPAARHVKACRLLHALLDSGAPVQMKACRLEWPGCQDSAMCMQVILGSQI